MRFTILGHAVLVAGVLAPATTFAQSTAPAAVGERVRIETPAQRGKFRYVGRVTAVAGDTLHILSDGVGPRAVPIADIRSLEVSGGRTTNGRAGMLYGSVGGAALGGLIGMATFKEQRTCDDFGCGRTDLGRSGNAFADAIAGGVLGLAAGGIWGMSHHTERWIRRSPGRGASLGISTSPGSGFRRPLGMKLGLIPAPRATGLGISVAF